MKGGYINLDYNLHLLLMQNELFSVHCLVHFTGFFKTFKQKKEIFFVKLASIHGPFAVN